MTVRWQQYAKDRPRVVDALVITLLFGLGFLGCWVGGIGPSGERIARWPGALLEGAACLALWWHRRLPRTVVAATVICANTAGALGYLLTPLLLAPVIAALYWLAVRTDRRTAHIGLVVVVALLVPTALVSDPFHHPLVLKTLGPAFWVLLPVAAGTAVRLRRLYREAVREETRHRIAEERVRIARELHDIVAHHLAVAHAQAGTAAHLVRTHPDRSGQILTDLAGTTSSALRELRAGAGLLRQAGESDAPLEPAPGLGQLPGLTAAFAAAGLTVTVTTEGEARPLSPGVDLTAYRIVQEALTNVTRHTAAVSARVRLAYAHNRLTITVSDDGGGAAPGRAPGRLPSRVPSRVPSRAPGRVPGRVPAQGGGFGLIGIQERARSVGGSLEVGPRPEGGFRVTTALPILP
ncbi:sensor histidine kinase [Streptomyces paludis]|uniref:histidine kinase n=1 Tax=Streptomyces paludis TaxID=2282738 RepID=A0A345HYC1_9ACTN|nr:sensor histidine kinase [Streptomyces paludis]AXG81695.1 sensor histidine kinase [Streptomyces paludis]